MDNGRVMRQWRELFANKKGRPLVMGILNITPDSFSGDGLISPLPLIERAVDQAQRFLDEGADIIDIGGESTRPNAQAVPADIEKARILPVIDALRNAGITAPLSLDSSKADVAQSALESGVDFINDVWAGKADEAMLPLIAKAGCGVVLMHNRAHANKTISHGELGYSYQAPDYGIFLDAIIAAMKNLAQSARQAGIEAEKIILDPGIGFGKSVAQNLCVINHVDRIKKETGYPILLGPSRKNFIGKVLAAKLEDRLGGTAAAVAVGVSKGADIVRVHDVKVMAQIVRMTHAIVQS